MMHSVGKEINYQMVDYAIMETGNWSLDEIWFWKFYDHLSFVLVCNLNVVILQYYYWKLKYAKKCSLQNVR